MMKEWATVVSWQDGVASLRCETQAGCSSCHSRSGCGARVLNELGPQTEHICRSTSLSAWSRDKKSNWAFPKEACCVPHFWFI